MRYEGIFVLLLCCFTFSVAHAAIEHPRWVNFTLLNAYPESIVWDAVGERFIFSSLKGGPRVLSVDIDGKVSTFASEVTEDPSQAEVPADAVTAGVFLDEPRDRILVALTSLKPGTKFGAVAAYGLKDGKRQLLVRVDDQSEDAAWLANDVTSDARGNIFLTNTYGYSIYCVGVDGKVSLFSNDSSFSSQPILVRTPDGHAFGLNGIVFHPDGFLLAAVSCSGKMYKLSLPKEGEEEGFKPVITIVDVPAESIAWADGIRIRPSDGKVIVTARLAVTLLDSTDQWESATVVERIIQDEPWSATNVALRDNKAYASFAFFSDFFSGADRSDFFIKLIEFEADSQPKNPFDDPWTVSGVFVLAVIILLLWATSESKSKRDKSKEKKSE